MTRFVAAGILLALASSAWPLDFASTSRPAILYDAPSTAAKKIAIVSVDYPLEKIVSTAGWIKVRDESGKLSWVEESALGTRQTLIVIAQEAAVMDKPAENAQMRFRATHSLVLDMQQSPENGWVKVRHASGQEGYIRAQDVWGL